MLGTLAASYAGCDKVKVVTLFTIGMATMGFFYSSMKVNVMDLTPNYAGPAMAMVNGVGAVAGVVSPSLIGYLIPNVCIPDLFCSPCPLRERGCYRLYYTTEAVFIDLTPLSFRKNYLGVSKALIGSVFEKTVRLESLHIKNKSKFPE